MFFRFLELLNDEAFETLLDKDQRVQRCMSSKKKIYKIRFGQSSTQKAINSCSMFGYIKTIQWISSFPRVTIRPYSLDIALIYSQHELARYYTTNRGLMINPYTFMRLIKSHGVESVKLAYNLGARVFQRDWMGCRRAWILQLAYHSKELFYVMDNRRELSVDFAAAVGRVDIIKNIERLRNVNCDSLTLAFACMNSQFHVMNWLLERGILPSQITICFLIKKHKIESLALLFRHIYTQQHRTYIHQCLGSFGRVEDITKLKSRGLVVDSIIADAALLNRNWILLSHLTLNERVIGSGKLLPSGVAYNTTSIISIPDIALLSLVKAGFVFPSMVELVQYMIYLGEFPLTLRYMLKQSQWQTIIAEELKEMPIESVVCCLNTIAM